MHIHSVGRDIPIRIDVGFKFHPMGYEPKYSESGYNAGLVGASSVREDLVPPAGDDAIRYDNLQTMSEPRTYTPRAMSHDGGLHGAAVMTITVESRG
ncbi:MAG: hypothetical protein OXC11_06900 [Rhodospirillales bacterium]|nr:hypothetical protein [Rhodospirillales bacterium]